jgi:hypothetical protein
LRGAIILKDFSLLGSEIVLERTFKDRIIA